jgi:polysaccharide export outer membrane protein
MKSNLFQLLSRSLTLALPVFLLGFAGCATSNTGVMNPPGGEYNGDSAVSRLHIGDDVTVSFDGLPDQILPHEETIKEDGSIDLDLIGHVKAAGKTTGELQDEIHDLYVPKYYTHLNVTVKTGDRVYYVRGEVKAPGRQLYVGQTTVTKAITSAGDFTDFANHRKVWLIRANGKRYKVDCDAILNGEAPDPPVYPGDQIVVERRLF